MMDSTYNEIYNKLINFVGELPVRTLHELLSVESNGVSVVLVWFDPVVEGVDVWFLMISARASPIFYYILCSFFVYVFVIISNK
jgi:hypothetical protein